MSLLSLVHFLKSRPLGFMREQQSTQFIDSKRVRSCLLSVILVYYKHTHSSVVNKQVSTLYITPQAEEVCGRRRRDVHTKI